MVPGYTGNQKEILGGGEERLNTDYGKEDRTGIFFEGEKGGRSRCQGNPTPLKPKKKKTMGRNVYFRPRP